METFHSEAGVYILQANAHSGVPKQLFQIQWRLLSTKYKL